MGAAALRWGSQLELVEAGHGRAKKLKLVGLLNPTEELEEIPLAAVANFAESTPHRAVRAFLVRGHRLAAAGLHVGDHVLVDAARDLFADPLVLAQVAGEYRLERASRVHALSHEPVILGAFVGVIRKRGFPSQRAADATVDRPPTRQRLLEGRLEMLEVTCAGTHNPRLQRALKIEAARVRKQLQSDACRD